MGFVGLQEVNEGILVTSGSDGASVQEDKGSTDVALVEAVKNGNRKAFESLLNKYRQRVYSIIYNLTSNREDAADLTQETFIKAFTSLNKFKNKSSFYTWLYRIAVNTTVTHLKRKRNRLFSSLESFGTDVERDGVFEAVSDQSDTDKAALRNELQVKLNEALQRLSVNHRTAIVLFEIEGLPIQSIANVMKCSEGTVKSRIHYAKLELQKHLKEYLN